MLRNIGKRLVEERCPFTHFLTPPMSVWQNRFIWKMQVNWYVSINFKLWYSNLVHTTWIAENRRSPALFCIPWHWNNTWRNCKDGIKKLEYKRLYCLSCENKRDRVLLVRTKQGLKKLWNFEARACIGLQRNLDFINKNVRLVIRAPFQKLRYYFCCINVLKILMFYCNS